MIIEGNNRDLGSIKVGNDTKFSVILKNESNKEQRITSVNPGCGSCTTASVDKVVLPPNSSAKMSVTFRPSSTGYNSKSINIDYYKDEPIQQASVTFRFTANVS